MGLSCSCTYDFDNYPGNWWYILKSEMNFEKFKKLRATRCISCNRLIHYGNLCLQFKRLRYPISKVEAKIYGDKEFELNYEPEIPMSSHYHCESCGEIYLNLTDIGYECINISENMNDLMDEYHKIIGFKLLKSI